MAYTLDKNSYRAQQYTRGRGGNKIRYIVIHHWDDPAKEPQFHAVCNYLINPAGREVSAHYIAEAGRVVQMVDEKDTAWHCGNWTKNQQSIGIECNPRCSEADLDTVAELCADIMKRHGKLTILGHKDCSPTGCPGRYYPPADKLAPYLKMYLAQKKPNTATPKPTPTTSSSTTHTVVHGDTLWAIAEKYLGDGKRYEEIKRLNKLSSNVIYSGQVLKVSDAKPDIDALADAVIRGEYGVGAERKKRLGSLYAEVQARINQKLGY